MENYEPVLACLDAKQSKQKEQCRHECSFKNALNFQRNDQRPSREDANVDAPWTKKNADAICVGIAAESFDEGSVLLRQLGSEAALLNPILQHEAASLHPLSAIPTKISEPYM